MITLLEDLRLALREVCRAIGLSGTALTVIPLVVLGVALNVITLTVIDNVRSERHSDHAYTTLRSAGKTELKAMRTVVIATLKKIGDGERKRPLGQNCVKGHKTKGTHVELGIASPAPTKGGGCDVEIIRGRQWKTAIASVKC